MSLELDAALNVFFSYSHRDEELRDALEKHLALLKRQGWIRAWHDRRIGAGREWEGEIDENLETADVVLLLVSPDFIASDYCYDRETGRAMERHENGEARVIPVILRPCDWQQAPFGKLQGLPKDARPVTSWEDRDEAFLDVARRIRAVVESRAPAYPDEATRDLSQALETAYEERAEREANGHATRALDKTIAGLKRELRQDGHLKEGDILNGRFRLQERIGQGGFAEVWKAFDRERRSLVAVKVLHSQYGRDKSRRDRFFRGARQMARLRGHPGIVDVLEEKCRDGGYWFFVMEYVAGRDFRRAVLAGELSLEERLAVVLEVGAALTDAHEKGIVHRDVKPANILLGRDGRAKLTDFDLVRAADTTGGTRTSMLGTFLYAAPEAMIDGKQAAEPADVYGLGMTALFAVFGADLPADVLWELREFLESLEVEEACREALRRAVERKIERRWRTAEEFCDALRGSLEPVEIDSSPSNRERVHEKDGSVLVYVPGVDAHTIPNAVFHIPPSEILGILRRSPDCFVGGAI